MTEAKSAFTADQVEVLRWIDRNDTHKSEWLPDGKPVRGKAMTYSAIQCAGPRGSIVIREQDWKAIRKFVTSGIGTDRDRSIHILTDEGRAALAKATLA